MGRPLPARPRPRSARAVALACIGAMALASGLLVAGCAGWSASPDLVLGLRNDTGSPVLVYVNDGWVGTVPAGTLNERIPSSGHGGPPYHVEARIASGKVLAAVDVSAAEAAATPGPGASPAGVTTTLPCGVIEIAAGGLPAASPSPSAGAATPPAKACE